MSTFKEKIKSLDDKFQAVFNKFITVPAVKKLLTLIKIPVDKIVSSSSANRIIRYSIIGAFAIGAYFCFSGGSIYKGQDLKEYTVLPEKISENIKQKGLIVPSAGIEPIITKKLTKDMVDNGIYSTNLINNTIDEYIDANIEKFIDLDASLEKVVLADFVNVSRELNTLAKKDLAAFARIDAIKSTDFINLDEVILKEDYLRDFNAKKSQLKDAVLADIKTKGYNVLRSYNSAENQAGIIAINLSEYTLYQDWKNALIESYKEKISLAKEEITLVAKDLVKKCVLKDISLMPFDTVYNNSFIVSKGERYLEAAKTLFSSSEKEEKLADYIYAKRAYVYLKSNIEFLKISAESIEEKLMNSTDKTAAKALELINDENLSYNEFYSKINELNITKSTKAFAIQPLDNAFFFVKDSKILKKNEDALKEKTKGLVSSIDLKKDFNAFVEANASRFYKNAMLQALLKLVGQDELKLAMAEMSDKFYEENLSTYVFNRIVMPYAYSNLKATQMLKNEKESMSIIESYQLVKNQLIEKDSNELEVILNKMTDAEKNKAVSDYIFISDEKYVYPKYNTSFGTDFFKIEKYNAAKYAAKSAFDDIDDYEDLVADNDEKTNPKKSDINLTNNPIYSSRILSFFMEIDAAKKAQAEALKQQIAQEKANAKEAERLAGEQKDKILKEDAATLLKEILALSKDYKGQDLDIKITSMSKTSFVGFDCNIPISEIDPTVESKKIITFTAEDLLKEKQDPNRRRGKVSESVNIKLFKGNASTKLSFSAYFAGELLFNGNVNVFLLDNKIIIPSDLRKNNNTISFEGKERYKVLFDGKIGKLKSNMALNSEVLAQTSYYPNVKDIFLKAATEDYTKKKEKGLIKDFPMEININEIDTKLDSAFFAKKLQATIRAAFDKVNPMNNFNGAPAGLEALGALSVAMGAANGDAFDMQAFANALPFDDRIRAEIARDADLKLLFNKVMEQQSMQALIKAQAEYDRSTKYHSSYERQISMSVENWISSAYDSSNLLSVTCLCVINKAVSTVMLQENITEEELINSIEFAGIVENTEVDDPNFEGLKRKVQKFKLDENAPVIAKRIFENMGLYIGQNTVRYYNYPASATFKASFSIVKTKDLYLPRILIK